jgi:CDP-glucose 4,6-dehydratase
MSSSDRTTAEAATSWTPDRRFWRDRRVAVTGATGFVGSHLTAQLVDLGAEVVTLMHDDVPASPIASRSTGQIAVVHGRIEDQPTVERMLGDHEAQTVFHLAAQSQVGVAVRNPVATFEANVAGTWAVLEASRRSPTVEHIVTASSDKAYGAQPVLPYDEDMPLLAVNPYDVSKACADLVAQSYHRTFELPVCVTRCGNLFGPGDHNWDRLIPGTIRSLVCGERPVIRSDGTMVRDYLYVVDGVLAYLCLGEAMSSDPRVIGHAFNFSMETPLTVLELVARLQAAAGTDLEPDVRATATHEIEKQFLSATKARKMLGWSPTFTLDDALVETVEWYRSYIAELG